MDKNNFCMFLSIDIFYCLVCLEYSTKTFVSAKNILQSLELYSNGVI